MPEATPALRRGDQAIVTRWKDNGISGHRAWRLMVTVATPRAARALCASHPLRVLNSFSGAINLVDDRGDVLALVSSESMLGPFALVVPDLGGRFRPAPRGNEPVERAGHGLVFGEHYVDGVGAALWDPRPDWRSLSEAIAGFESLPDLPVCGLEDSAGRLGIALSRNDMAAVAAATLRLAGSGPGLTPAGDDVLVGAIHALWSTRSERTARGMCEEISRLAAPRTTLLSAAWLHAAARGEASAPWHGVFGALVGRESPGAAGVAAAWQGVLGLGETSGAAAVRGFTEVLVRSSGRAAPLVG